jgi:hypothetical protein
VIKVEKKGARDNEELLIFQSMCDRSLCCALKNVQPYNSSDC